MTATLTSRGQEGHASLRACFTLALLLALSVPAQDAELPPFAPPEASSADDKSEVVELAPLPVVGTRIRGIDLESTLPVQRFTTTDLEATGFSRFDDTLRSMPMDAGDPQSGVMDGTKSTPGISTVNLRGFGSTSVNRFGIGSNSGLVLIDGLRMPMHSGGGMLTPYNLNIIPASSIESVEVLKDGASAIYGSDAPGGVINIRTIRGFRGTQVRFGLGQTEGTGSGEVSARVRHGRELSERANLVVSLDAYERNHLRRAEHGFMASPDYRNRGGFNFGSTYIYPARLRVPDPDHPWSRRFATYAEPTSDPTLEGLQTTPGSYFVTDGGLNLNRWSDYLGDRQDVGAYLHLDFALTDRIKGLLDLSFQRNWTRTALAPAPYDLEIDFVGGAVFPAGNPYNPFGVARVDGGTPMDLGSLRGRFIEAGPRVIDVTIKVPRVVAGLEGRFLADWLWQLAGVWSESASRKTTENALRQDRFLELAGGTDLNGDGVIGREEYLNPFGHNSEELLDYMRDSDGEKGTFGLWMLDAHATGSLWENGDWKLKAAFGGEVRGECIRYRAGAAGREGLILGRIQTSDTSGDRTIAAGYAEFDFRLRDSFTVQAAGRFEHYSDFGQVWTPKIAASWRPLPEVMLRGSRGRGFIAPNLPFLHKPVQTDLNPWFTAMDPKRDEGIDYLFNVITRGNPKLEPLRSVDTGFGLVLEPFTRLGSRGGIWQYLEGLTIGIDHTEVKITDAIVRPENQWLLDHEDELEVLYPGAGLKVERDPPEAGETWGRIRLVNLSFINITEHVSRGYDLWFEWPIPLGAFGDLRLRWDFNRLESLRLADEEYVGTDLQPPERWVGKVSWTRGAWSTDWWFQRVEGLPHNEVYASYPTSGPSFRINAQISYAGLERTRITLGARNLLNRDPPFDALSSIGFHPSYPSEQRFWYLRVERWF